MSTKWLEPKKTDLMKLGYAVCCFAKEFNRYPEDNEKYEFICLNDFSLYYDRIGIPCFIKIPQQDCKLWIHKITSQKFIDLLTDQVLHFLKP